MEVGSKYIGISAGGYEMTLKLKILIPEHLFFSN